MYKENPQESFRSAEIQAAIRKGFVLTVFPTKDVSLIMEAVIELKAIR